jgi:hypothetical protein
LGHFTRPDVLKAILDLIQEALLWKLDVYIGLSNTSLADRHGHLILAFLKKLPKPISAKRPAVQVELKMVIIASYCHEFQQGRCAESCMILCAGTYFQTTAIGSAT